MLEITARRHDGSGYKMFKPWSVTELCNTSCTKKTRVVFGLIALWIMVAVA